MGHTGIARLCLTRYRHRTRTDCSLFKRKEAPTSIGGGGCHDVAAYLDTLEKIKELNAKLFVPAHTPAAKDIKELVDQVHTIAHMIVELCETPLCFENLLSKVFDHFGLQTNFEQYVLVGSTVRSYLSWLKDQNKIDAFFDGNNLYWHTKK